MYKFMTSSALLILAVVSATVGYKFAEQKIESAIYRDRLEAIAGEYRTLRDRYNQAVARTAVTELIVKDGRLSVAIRDAHGVSQLIDTGFDPSNEIYCDYLVMDGRLWIRRVYDDRTPPAMGLVIDPTVADVDWSNPMVKHGSAVYRSLTEGRWVVTVTGDGSLGLAKQQGDKPIDLIATPPVRDYEQIEQEINAEVKQIGLGDVLGQLW